MKTSMKKSMVLAAVCGAAASAASAQSITTLFNTNNNGNAGGGIYFQIVVGPSPITITSIDENSGAVARHAASQRIVFGESTDPDEAIAALDAVTFEEVREIAAGIGEQLAVACVGPHSADEF